MLASESACYRHKRDACIKGNTPNIPPKHLFFAKKQPLILGHRGQAKKFQENTMEGIKSVEELGADGFEVDVYLTDFNQLVLFPSDNAKVIVIDLPFSHQDLEADFIISRNIFDNQCENCSFKQASVYFIIYRISRFCITVYPDKIDVKFSTNM